MEKWISNFRDGTANQLSNILVIQEDIITIQVRRQVVR